MYKNDVGILIYDMFEIFYRIFKIKEIRENYSE